MAMQWDVRSASRSTTKVHCWSPTTWGTSYGVSRRANDVSEPLRGSRSTDALVSSGAQRPPQGGNSMLVSHAEPMPSLSPTGGVLNALWPRTRAMAIATAEGLLQARCGLGGHVMAMRFEKNRMS